MTQILKSFGLFLTLTTLMACASTPVGQQRISEGDYLEILEAQTHKVQKYDGLQATMELGATFLSSKVQEAQLNRQADLLQWGDAELQQEKNKRGEENLKQTEIFVTFFTPERKHDDLSRSKTLWKIFLDTDGRRYEGKATKIKLLTAEIASLYPQHNNFSTPYKVVFPVSLATVEGKPATLTITGPVGSAVINF